MEPDSSGQPRPRMKYAWPHAGVHDPTSSRASTQYCNLIRRPVRETDVVFHWTPSAPRKTPRKYFGFSVDRDDIGRISDRTQQYA